MPGVSAIWCGGTHHPVPCFPPSGVGFPPSRAEVSAIRDRDFLRPMVGFPSSDAGSPSAWPGSPSVWPMLQTQYWRLNPVQPSMGWAQPSMGGSTQYNPVWGGLNPVWEASNPVQPSMKGLNPVLEVATQYNCIFQLKARTQSNRIRALNPIQSAHLIQSKACTPRKLFLGFEGRANDAG